MIRSFAVVAFVVSGCAGAKPETRRLDPRCGDRRTRGAIEVAVTVDDLPVHGRTEGYTPATIVQRFLAAFEKHHLPPVYGLFVGGRATMGNFDAVWAWVGAGNLLGNHTFSHGDGAVLSFDAFVKDVVDDEALLGQVMGERPEDQGKWKVFRFPYLRQGSDLESAARRRAFLESRGYRIADVSLGFDDWAYTEPYGRCLLAHDAAAIQALFDSALEHAEADLDFGADAACRLVGRPIKQVLVLHAGAFTSELIDRLLDRYERKGVRFIGLDEALADPVYRDPASTSRSFRGPLFYRLAAAHPEIGLPIPVTPDPALDGVCAGWHKVLIER